MLADEIQGILEMYLPANTPPEEAERWARRLRRAGKPGSKKAQVLIRQLGARYGPQGAYPLAQVGQAVGGPGVMAREVPLARRAGQAAGRTPKTVQSTASTVGKNLLPGPAATTARGMAGGASRVGPIVRAGAGAGTGMGLGTLATMIGLPALAAMFGLPYLTGTWVEKEQAKLAREEARNRRVANAMLVAQEAKRGQAGMEEMRTARRTGRTERDLRAEQQSSNMSLALLASLLGGGSEGVFARHQGAMQSPEMAADLQYLTGDRGTPPPMSYMQSLGLY